MATEIITRTTWGSRFPSAYKNNTQLRAPLNEWVIHTEAGAKDTVRSLDGDIAHIKNIERFHVETRKFTGGIGYSFLVTPSGRIFQGRGWLRAGAHTQQGRNFSAHAICFTGHGDLQPATAAQWEAAKWLIRFSLVEKLCVPDYIVSGHRQYTAKSCPGNLVYPHIGQLRGLKAGNVLQPKPPVTQPVEDLEMVTNAFAIMHIPDAAGKRHVYLLRDHDGRLTGTHLNSLPLAGHLARLLGIPYTDNEKNVGHDWAQHVFFVNGPLQSA